MKKLVADSKFRSFIVLFSSLYFVLGSRAVRAMKQSLGFMVSHQTSSRAVTLVALLICFVLSLSWLLALEILRFCAQFLKSISPRWEWKNSGLRDPKSTRFELGQETHEALPEYFLWNSQFWKIAITLLPVSWFFVSIFFKDFFVSILLAFVLCLTVTFLFTNVATASLVITFFSLLLIAQIILDSQRSPYDLQTSRERTTDGQLISDSSDGVIGTAKNSSDSADYNLLILAFDELSWDALSTSGVEVSAKLDSFSEFGKNSITFVNAFSVYPFTEWALPAMLTDQTNLSELDENNFYSFPQSLGIMEAAAQRFDFFSNSRNLSCSGKNCGLGGASPTLTIDVADNFAVILQQLPDKIADWFPSIGGKFVNFWNLDIGVASPSTYDEDGTRKFSGDATFVKVGSGASELIIETEDPWVALYHSYVAHHPWNLDANGLRTSLQVPEEFPDSYLPFQCGNGEGFCTEELNELAKWSYYNSVMAADREVAYLFDQLRTSDLRRPTLVLITSDHGISFPDDGGDGRRPDELGDIHSLVNVPLILGVLNSDGSQSEIGGTSADGTVTPGVVVTSILNSLLSGNDPLEEVVDLSVSGGFTSVRPGSLTSERSEVVDFDDVLRQPREVFSSSELPPPSVESVPLGEEEILQTGEIYRGGGESGLATYLVVVDRRACDGEIRLVAGQRSTGILWERDDEVGKQRGWTIAPRTYDPEPRLACG